MVKQHKNQSGQTLIETIVAIGILVTTLTAGLALAIYVLSNAGINQNEITATNLAREGVEVVRMMRDTNWLAWDAADPSGTSGSGGLQSCNIGGNTVYCYPMVRKAAGNNAQSKDLRQTTGSTLEFNKSNDTWNIGGASDFTLYQDQDTTSSIYGMYGVSSSDSRRKATNYSRKVEITDNTGSPYASDGNNNSNAEMIVKVTVGWFNTKHCPGGISKNDPTKFSSNCKVVVEEHLTNWKDYK